MGVTFIAPQGTYTAPAKLVTKEITENGTYDATDDSANGYSSVTVNVEGGGGSWQTVFEGSVTTESEGNFASGDIVGLESLNGDSVKVTFNGAEYTLPKHELGYGEMGYGNVPDFTNYPVFIETTDTPCLLYTESAGTYTLKIEEPQSGGSSDFGTAEVTFINNTPAVEYINGAFIDNNMIPYVSEIRKGTSTKQAVIYRSGSKAYVDDEEATILVSGNATCDDGVITITGNCTITIS